MGQIWSSALLRRSLLGLTLSALGCASHTPPIAPAPATGARPAAAPAPAPSTKTAEDVPRLRLEADRVLIDDQLVASLERGRPERIDLLSDAMKARRSDPQGEPARPYDLSVVDEVNGAQLKSAVQTAAAAGWPMASLNLGENSLALHVRMPESPGEPKPFQLPWPRESLIIVVRADSVELFRASAAPPEDEPSTSLYAIAANNVSSAVPYFLQLACANGRACSPTALIVADDAPFSLIHVALRSLTTLGLEEGRPVVELRESQPQPRAPGTPLVEVGGVAPTQSGRLAPELILKTIRASSDKYQKCYEAGLARDPKLTGRIYVRFMIGRDGKVPRATTGTETTMPDARVTQCVVKHFRGLQFPLPEGGTVLVTYPLILPTSE